MTSIATILWQPVSLGETEEFQCSVTYPRPVSLPRCRSAVVNLDGYLVRPSEPEGTE